MAWRWAARRFVISSFLIVHLAVTILWVLPICPLRQYFEKAASYYIMPLGLWQAWGMFAPDPMRDTATLEAEVIDAGGMRHFFAFTRVGDYSKLGAVPRFRHSKYSANLVIPEFEIPRLCAMRYVVRKLGLNRDAFPLDVHLLYQIRPTPPLGQPADPMTPTQPLVLGTHHFETREDVYP